MLRVGVWLDSYTSSAWVAKVIQDIQSSEFARVELVILNSTPPDSSPSLLTRLRHDWRFGLFRRFEQWDYLRNRTKDDALANADVSALLSEVPSMAIHPNDGDIASTVSEGQVAELRARNLDVILDLGQRPVRGDILSAARYGVWSFDFGENPHLFWQIYDRDFVSKSALCMLSNQSGGGRIVYQSQAATDFRSLHLNRNPIYWKTATFAIRGLRDLHDRDAAYFESLPVDHDRDQRAKRAPNPLRMVIYGGKYFFRKLEERLASPRSGPTKKWCIVVRPRSAARRFDDPAGYQLVPSAKDRFYADPILVEKDGKTFLFFEDFRYAEGRAVISYCEIGSDGKATSQPTEVLRCPFHLSYPFIFEHEGEMYMVPETKGNRRIELYRATSFPHTWVPEAVLLDDIHAVDATIHKANGKFWMFVSVSDGRYSNWDELSIYFADSLKGPWTPHPRNPLVSDVERARPAGALFYDEGRLIRPSQDCSKAYGYALVFAEVLTLTETEYEERPAGRLNPESIPGNIANHTYNRTEHFEVIDRDLLAKMAGSVDDSAA